MSTDTTTAPESVDTTEVDTDEVPMLSVDPSKEEFEKGTWQAAVQRAAVLVKKSANDKKRAGVLLWQGATSAIAEWLEDNTDDVNGEGLAHALLEVMGTARKGDVSKIKTVGLAALNHGLVPADWDNLSKAYAEATRLTKVAPQQEAEDNAADAAIEAKASSVPSSASTIDDAAAIVLSRGVDEAARAILDGLNTETDEDGKPVNNVAAHRAFLRAVSADINGRVRAPKREVSDEDKEGATKATPKAEGSTPRAAAKSGATKGKAVPAANKRTTANDKALPPKKTASQIEADDIAAENAAAAEANGAPTDPSTGDDIDSMLAETETEAPASAKPAAKKATARPAVQRR